MKELFDKKIHSEKRFYYFPKKIKIILFQKKELSSHKNKNFLIFPLKKFFLYFRKLFNCKFKSSELEKKETYSEKISYILGNGIF